MQFTHILKVIVWKCVGVKMKEEEKIKRERDRKEVVTPSSVKMIDHDNSSRINYHLLLE